MGLALKQAPKVARLYRVEVADEDPDKCKLIIVLDRTVLYIAHGASVDEMLEANKLYLRMKAMNFYKPIQLVTNVDGLKAPISTEEDVLRLIDSIQKQSQ